MEWSSDEEGDWDDVVLHSQDSIQPHYSRSLHLWQLLPMGSLESRRLVDARTLRQGGLIFSEIFVKPVKYVGA